MTEHIVKLLEERPLASLSKAERDFIEAHVAACSDCFRAYEAAQAALLLLRGRASMVATPPPFFETRVLAAMRSKRTTSKRLGLTQLWETARPLFASMAMSIIMLLAFTFYGERSQPTAPPPDLALVNAESPDWVVLGSDDDDEMTDTQALEILYYPTIEAGDSNGK